MSETFSLNAAPSEARWYVEIIIGRDVLDDRADVKPYADGKPAVIGTETESIDGYTAQEDRPTVKELNTFVPEGWKRLESTISEIDR
jgi:hypothetical protein